MQVQSGFRGLVPPFPLGVFGDLPTPPRVVPNPGDGKRRTTGIAAIDPGARLLELAPILRALAGPAIEFDLALGYPNARMRADPFAFDATIVELVTGACIAGARRIIVRNRKIGSRLWVLVCDDGDHCPSGAEAPRIHDFRLGSHGRVRAKYPVARGRAVALTFPNILGLAGAQPISRPYPFVRKPKEKSDDQDRQPVAA
ncbi:hypothetical protein NED98_07975 [Sphingomonas sp. MMSM20]|uniref:hypothetical protein n=1 Tax=Sphingomonas lycopersici TaxID=2951807 RepID=UPI002237887A|nr:hypothetical protein [Sphingomonas lycopersici]MCW6530181.1 hypothetical protein [Sphingomonas lycopersici]